MPYKGLHMYFRRRLIPEKKFGITVKVRRMIYRQGFAETPVLKVITLNAYTGHRSRGRFS